MISFCQIIYYTLLLSTSPCFSANILGIVTIPLLSHQIQFQPLWKELSLRGHNVTLLTTHPIGNSSLTNLTEIHLHYLGEMLPTKELFVKIMGEDESMRALSETLKQFNMILTQAIMKDNRIQKLVSDDYHFDLVVTEIHLTTMFAFAWKFKCPWIGIVSMDAPRYYHYVMGNPIHPLIHPDPNFRGTSPYGLTFLEKFQSLAFNIYFYMDPHCPGYMQEATESLKEYFGNDMPPLKEIVHNMSLLFITTHPMTHNIKALQPNTLEIGTGMHIKEHQSLPEDIQEFMDQATHGVIYFAFGSNVMHDLLKEMPFFKNIVEGLEELPYKILFKADKDMETVPENFKTGKWMPQQDILRHKNVKLFVTHGGLQSLQETIYNGVPIIALPIFGDGFSNANKAARMGYGLKLDTNTLTKEAFKDAVEEVIRNPKYREKVQEAMRIYRDEEIPSLQRAVYWTEYVIRHKGARHLRNPFLDIPAWEYYMIDVFAFVAIVLGTIIFVFYKTVRFGYFLLFRKNSLKVHSE